MIGNDVVDLADGEAAVGAIHPRFDGRVFSESELAALEGRGPRHRMRWILWAAKESAFKLARRLDPGVAFSPRRFIVSLDANLRGRVRHGDRSFPLRVNLVEDAAHAVAALSEAGAEAVVTRVERLGSIRDTTDDAHAPSRAACALALGDITRRLGCRQGELHIERRGRVPWLRNRSMALRAPLSLAHHGRFIAYACLLPDGNGAEGSL